MSQSPATERLQKVIARSGLASRRAAEDLIAAGRVTVDGHTAHLGQKVDADVDRIEIDAVLLPTAPGLVYYLLNKPPHVVSTSADTHGRTTVLDFVPAEPRVYPVGRLDAESTGLLLLTNDGELTNLITHPRHGVTKTYEVLVEGKVTPAEVRLLESGVDLDDGPAKARGVRIIDQRGAKAHIEIVMGEGRKREIRRMFETLGHPVIHLHRAAVGALRDRDLKEGEWRALSIGEVRELYASAGQIRDYDLDQRTSTDEP